MGVLSSYLLSSVNDAMLPHLRGPVEEVFEGVVQHKGLPTRADFRELRNRVDMLDYRCREATRLLHEIRGQAKRAIQSADDAESAHSG
jgi:hypothetical protein